MSTNSFQSLHHHSLLKRHLIDYTPTSSTTLSLKPTTTTTTLSHSSTTTLSISASSATTPTTSPTTPSPSSTSLNLLQTHLSTQNFRQADDETRRLIIALAGEQAITRGYVYFSEVQFIPLSNLKAIDDLWVQFSNGRFGYSVQKKIWNKANRDFTDFFIKVGWMKKLDTEVLQYNYKAFPDEFIWELNNETPEGHLPLTNALRGTQLLQCILLHPAFEDDEENEVLSDQETGETNGGLFSKKLSKKEFKSDYSF